MLGRISAIRSLGTKTALGAVTIATVLLAACGTPTTSGGSPSTNASLLACTATVQDLSTGTGGQATATKASPAVSGKIQVDGSSALAPLFQAAANEFDTVNGTQTSVTPNGSGNGLKDVESGAVNIGLSDFFAQVKEPTGDPHAYDNLIDHQPAAVIFTLVVSNDLAGKVNNLTAAQIKQIYTGQVTNWSQLGGPNELISVVNRPLASGTRYNFKTYVLGGASESAGSTLTQDTTGAVAAAVKATPGSIGYVATGFVTGQYANDLHPICIDGYDASPANVNSGKYQYWGIEHAYTKGPATGGAKALLQYIASSQVQQNDLLKLSYIPLASVAPSAIASHTPSGAPSPEQLGS